DRFESDNMRVFRVWSRPLVNGNPRVSCVTTVGLSVHAYDKCFATYAPDGAKRSAILWRFIPQSDPFFVNVATADTTDFFIRCQRQSLFQRDLAYTHAYRVRFLCYLIAAPSSCVPFR